MSTSTIIRKEFDEFDKYHKNKYNLIFHVICGFCFMSSLFLLTNDLSLIMYTLLLFLTISELKISVAIFIVLFTMVKLLKNYNFSTKAKLLSFLTFYFLPDLSHYLTNEPTMLNISDVTPLSAFTNIFYLLPFSITCLFKSS